MGATDPNGQKHKQPQTETATDLNDHRPNTCAYDTLTPFVVEFTFYKIHGTQ